MTLCVGPSASGKSSLLYALQQGNSSEDYVPVPTIGNNLVDIKVAPKQNLTVRELGGEMVPIWKLYFDDCQKLLFVIDSSDPQLLSVAYIQLFDCLSDDMLCNARVCICFTKTDLPSCVSLAEYKAALRIPDILSQASQDVTVLETSAHAPNNLDQLIDWLKS